ncbi:hypothetical protein CLB51_24510 [Salmonella enterica]|nr:hypothetical protein [Salmonella enterica]EBZ4888480.1 hypothetical protein [Salmonella enterica subsp. enterica serovar Bredeney]EDR9399191.1 hypothetical protein [Salmonella enterica subsp. enterica]EDT6893220.1 hypothetical protein [Salmonella enterica subsp. enterica serovar Javiana]EDX5193562.1 hypothetical protein [Salmonella enterica subsp. enterica serovar Glostrup]
MRFYAGTAEISVIHNFGSLSLRDLKPNRLQSLYRVLSNLLCQSELLKTVLSGSCYVQWMDQKDRMTSR